MSTSPAVRAFFDEPTNNVTYVVSDPATKACAIIDSVRDYDAACGRTGTAAADRVAAFVTEAGLRTEWLLETHVHADHLSAAPYLKDRLGGRIAIGERVVEVQAAFAELFNAGETFAADGSQFDRLFGDGEAFSLGALEVRVLHGPGHTPACVAYHAGDALFVGDTLFMPDSGTARCDFPGGSAARLYRSIRRLLALAPETRVFVNHDYGADGQRGFAWETTVAEQRRGNIHVRDGISESEFVAMRKARDATLSLPQLILPAVQVNMRAGCLPPPESNGRRYLKIPLDAL